MRSDRPATTTYCSSVATLVRGFTWIGDISAGVQHPAGLGRGQGVPGHRPAPRHPLHPRQAEQPW